MSVFKICNTSSHWKHYFVYLFLSVLFVSSSISNYSTASLLLKTILSVLSFVTLFGVAGKSMRLKPDAASGWFVLSIPVYTALSLFWSENLSFGMLKLIHLLTLFIPFYLLANNLAKFFHLSSFLLWKRMAIGIGVAISLWIILAAPIDMATDTISVSIPFTGRIVTYVTVLLLLLLFNGNASNLMYGALLILITGLSVISFRAGIIAVTFIAIIVSVLYSRRREFSSVFFILGVLILGVGIGTLISDNLNYRSAWVNDAIAGSGIADISVSIRIDAFKLAFSTWYEASFFGVGAGGFNDANLPGSIQSIMRYPHNIVMEVLCEYGLFGILLFSVTLVAFFREMNFRRIVKSESTDVCFGILLMMLTSGVLSLFSKDLSHNIILYLLGYMLVSWSNNQDKRSI